MIKYSLLNQYKQIAHFCTSREGGVSVGNYASFNLSPFSGDNPVDFAENQRILCKKLGINSGQLIIPIQTHETEIRLIDEDFFELSADKKFNYLHGVDALLTQLPEVCIGVTTADCVPLLFYDPIKQVIAVVHAGWRGTCARISEKTVQEMVLKFDCKPENILVTIGPSISVKVYEIGKEVEDNFEKAGFETAEIIQKRNNSIFLDLWKANQLSLEKAGIMPKHIEIAGICTFTEHERFFSARQLGIKSGRLLSGIMLKKPD